jgi:hypothetical protein
MAFEFFTDDYIDRRSSVESSNGGKIITGQFWTFTTISATRRKDSMCREAAECPAYQPGDTRVLECLERNEIKLNCHARDKPGHDARIR